MPGSINSLSWGVDSSYLQWQASSFFMREKKSLPIIGIGLLEEKQTPARQGFPLIKARDPAWISETRKQLVGGLCQPIWKKCSSKWESSPIFGVKINKYLSCPPPLPDRLTVFPVWPHGNPPPKPGRKLSQSSTKPPIKACYHCNWLSWHLHPSPASNAQSPNNPGVFLTWGSWKETPGVLDGGVSPGKSQTSLQFFHGKQFYHGEIWK